MIQSVDKIQTEEVETELTVEQLQAVVSEHFGKTISIVQATNRKGEPYERLAIEIDAPLLDGSLPISCALSNMLRMLASKSLAAASRIDELAGYTEEPDLYVRQGSHRVAIYGLDDDLDIDILNAKSNEDAIRQAREAFAYMTGGKPVQKPANAGPVKLQTVKPEYRFQCDAGRFQSCEIVVHDQQNERLAKQEATAFIDWLQAQAAPDSADQQELKIA